MCMVQDKDGTIHAIYDMFTEGAERPACPKSIYTTVDGKIYQILLSPENGQKYTTRENGTVYDANRCSDSPDSGQSTGSIE